MTSDDVRALLKAKVEEAGSQSEYCRRTGVCFQQVNATLNRVSKNPPTAILNALGLKKVITFEPK